MEQTTAAAHILADEAKQLFHILRQFEVGAKASDNGFRIPKRNGYALLHIPRLPLR